MVFRTLSVSALAGALMLSANVALAADSDQTEGDREQDRTQQRDQDRVYGWSLMSERERIEHRNKMHSFRTVKEREAYLQEHHRQMQERAKAMGVTLSDEPPMRGRGMMGPAGGMGPGGGMMEPGYRR